MTRLRVIVANVYRGNDQLEADLELFGRVRPVAVGVGEGWHIGRTRRYGFRTYRTARAGRASKEVPVLMRRSSDVHVERARYVRGARGVAGSRIAKERWITVIRATRRGRPFSIINTHMHAAIRGNTRTRRGRQYRRHMKRLMRIARAERAAGYPPVVTMDGNYPLRGERPAETWRWSPWRALPRAGITWRAPRGGLDGYGFDRATFEEYAEPRLLEPHGSDHPFYVLARLRWRA